MSIKLIAGVFGSLFPIIFPKQEFKPKRLIGLVICVALAAGSINLLGVDGTEQLLDVVADLMDLAEQDK